MEEFDTRITMNTEKMKQKLLQFDDEILGRAIGLLDVLIRPGTRAILEYLHEHREAAYVDLLVHSGQEDLEPDLRNMVSAGILEHRESYYTTLYRINQKKLFRIRRAALSMMAPVEEAPAFLKSVEIRMNP